MKDRLSTFSLSFCITLVNRSMLQIDILRKDIFSALIGISFLRHSLISLMILLFYTIIGLIILVGFSSAEDSTLISFGDKDEIEIFDSLCPGDVVLFNLTTMGDHDFFIVYLNHVFSTISMKVEAIDKSFSKTGSESQMDSGIQHVIIKPEDMRLCRYDDKFCSVSVSLESLQDGRTATEGSCEPLDFKITFVKGIEIKFGQKLHSHVSKLRVKRYGIQIEEFQMDVLFSLVPDRKSTQVDVDLFIYHEDDLMSLIFPNSDPDDQNHHWNTPEHALITKSGNQQHSGFFLVYVLGSTESGHNDNKFDLIVYSNYDVMTIYISLAGSVIGLILSMMCLVCAIALFVRV